MFKDKIFRGIFLREQKFFFMCFRKERPMRYFRASRIPEDRALKESGQSPVTFETIVRGWLARKGRDPRREHLDQLWKNWSMVMGPELSALARPLGHREGQLLVGGEDNLVLQELSYHAPEMLERANAFMDGEFFRRVELHLLEGRTPLDERPYRVLPVPRRKPVRPEYLGTLTDSLDPASPVGRCYRAYLRMFEPEK